MTATETIFICNKHENFVVELDRLGALKPSTRCIINRCCIQLGCASSTRCTGIATGWRVDVLSTEREAIRTGHTPDWKLFVEARK